MPEKPKRASENKSEQVELVRATCLYVATKLGDLMDDLVVVGGLVPSLLIAHETLPEDTAAHVGTMDLDVGLTLALLDEGRYRKLTERLRDAGFTMDTNDDGNPTRQRWKITNSGTVAVDFLIQPSLAGDKGGKLRDIEPDFAAIIAPGLKLAFQERILADRKLARSGAQLEQILAACWEETVDAGPYDFGEQPLDWGNEQALMPQRGKSAGGTLRSCTSSTPPRARYCTSVIGTGAPSTVTVQFPSSAATPPQVMATRTSAVRPANSAEAWSSPSPIHDQVRLAISAPSHSSLKPFVSSLRATATACPSSLPSHRVERIPIGAP